MDQNETVLFNPTTIRYSGSGFGQPTGQSLFSSRSLRTSSSYPPSRVNPRGASSNPYAQLYAQTSSPTMSPPTLASPSLYATARFTPTFSSSAYYPANPYLSGFPPTNSYAPVYPDGIYTGTERPNSHGGLEAVLIAILVLTALDLTLVRPYKYSLKE
ncbi:MAG: hypothetical protein QMC95_10390 [Desulfitobacteriaceae bacterium]|nr:hypothetical protein [Desulfitobacteriaceae bacterium]MDI6880373.1 hypothetical protein [Desulfitobacteriaceae bacterium]MDI6914618.1 hypothetical protein [Desulfitobacteriaceae bacterium]